jgi:hypothetical protein
MLFSHITLDQASKPLVAELLKLGDSLRQAIAQLLSSGTLSLQDMGMTLCELLLEQNSDAHEVIKDSSTLWAVAATVAHRDNDGALRERGLALLVSLAHKYEAAALHLRNAHVKAFARRMDGKKEGGDGAENDATSADKSKELAEARAKAFKEARKIKGDAKA